jgi:ribosomal protein S18 acetylase RimI-like enzyme
MIRRLPTRVWHLAMRSPADLQPARDPGAHVTVARAAVPLGALNAFFYSEVGREHHWVDRLVWSSEQWQIYAERPTLETWLVHDSGTPAGYAELDGTHIAMFGILPAFQGRGLGGHLLTEVTRRAWERTTAGGVVTLDTCELDAPHALANYRARGYEVAREGIERRGRF